MNKCKKGRESACGCGNRLAKRIDEICATIESMALVDPSGRLTDEEITALCTGMLTAFNFAIIALDPKNPEYTEKILNAPVVVLAAGAFKIAAKSHAHQLGLDEEG